MLLIDAHLDLAMNALQWNRDLTRSVYTIRTTEQQIAGKGRGHGTVAFPEMRQGRVALSFATVIARSTGRPIPHIDYDHPSQAFAMAQGHLAYYRTLEGVARIITNRSHLDAHWAEWTTWESNGANPGEEPPLGFMLSMEGADPILSPGQVDVWHKAGLRAIGLAHYGPGRYAGGTGTELGLSELGPALLQEMERLGIMLDLTHLSDQAFWQALDIYSGPVLASHSNCRAIVPHQRQFSDEQLKAIIERGGVIGISLDVWMVSTGWQGGQQWNQDILLEHIIPHIDHICQIAGNAQNIAIGTDLDGGFGREQAPADLDTIADLQRIPQLLRTCNYTDEDIAAICHNNWLRLLRPALDCSE